MTDREKVIKGLELCKQDAKLCFAEIECPYQCEFPRCCLKLMADALELLEEQEPIPCGEKIKAGDIVLDFHECGYCKNAIRKPWRYCPFCGKAVKWDA